MACGCKNKQNVATKATPTKPSSPRNNGNPIGGRRVEKRIIR